MFATDTAAQVARLEHAERMAKTAAHSLAAGTCSTAPRRAPAPRLPLARFSTPQCAGLVRNRRVRLRRQIAPVYAVAVTGIRPATVTTRKEITMSPTAWAALAESFRRDRLAEAAADRLAAQARAGAPRRTPALRIPLPWVSLRRALASLASAAFGIGSNSPVVPRR
jgi:hypothetical protein